MPTFCPKNLVTNYIKRRISYLTYARWNNVTLLYGFLNMTLFFLLPIIKLT